MAGLYIKNVLFLRMFGFWSSRRIYLDHAATTLLDGRVLRVMKKVFSRNYFNPGALYC